MPRLPPILALLCALVSTQVNAQAIYAGTLGKQPIHLVGYTYSDGAVSAFYVYDRHDTPIRINGRLQYGVLELQEMDGETRTATLRLAIDEDGGRMRGEWRPANGKAALPVTLDQQLALDPHAPHSGPPVEMLQAASTPDHYFTILIDSATDGEWPRVVGVNVHRKRTDALVQTFAVDTQYLPIDSVGTGDFNFDGVLDFSLFEAGSAGPDTSSLYFLRTVGTGRYALSEFAGSSLDFDAKAKLVHEHNQCCAGRSHVNATYRVAGNRLELIERKCSEHDGESGEMIDVPCEP